MTTQDHPPQVSLPPSRSARPAVAVCWGARALRARCLCGRLGAKPRVLRVCAADACAARARQIVVKEVVQGGSAWRSGMVGLAAEQARLLASCAAAPSPRSPPSAARIELPTGPRRHLTALVVVCRL